MLNFKRILAALIIACSMGTMATYSTQAAAATTLPPMRPNKLVVKDVLKSLNEALAAIDNKESKDVVMGHIQKARQFSKEITVGSLGAIVDRGADAIIGASRNTRLGDMDAARKSLEYAIEEYTEMGRKTSLRGRPERGRAGKPPGPVHLSCPPLKKTIDLGNQSQHMNCHILQITVTLLSHQISLPA